MANLDLAFDVYFFESTGTQMLKMSGGFANFHAELVAFFGVDYMLCTMGLEEFTTCLIIIEAKFVSEETQRNLRISTTS